MQGFGAINTAGYYNINNSRENRKKNNNRKGKCNLMNSRCRRHHGYVGHFSWNCELIMIYASDGK